MFAGQSEKARLTVSWLELLASISFGEVVSVLLQDFSTYFGRYMQGYVKGSIASVINHKLQAVFSTDRKSFILLSIRAYFYGVFFEEFFFRANQQNEQNIVFTSSDYVNQICYYTLTKVRLCNDNGGIIIFFNKKNYENLQIFM